MQQTNAGWAYRVLRRAAGWRWEVMRHGECLAAGLEPSAVRARAKALQAVARMAHRPNAATLVLKSRD